jgi:DNA-binding MarR family transcriptional regulator
MGFNESAPDSTTTAESARDALAADLERLAVGAVGLTTRALAQADTGFELTFPQWRALLLLGASDDGARIGEVAARLGATVPATGRLLRRLERRGLTVLSVDELDRRATRVRLSDGGQLVRAAILGRRRAMIRDIAAAFPEPGRLNLVDGLGAIAAELERFA